MKFTTVAVLASTAAAGTVAPRAASDIVLGVLNSVSTQISAVDSAAKAYTGGVPSDALKAGQSLIDALTAGKTKVGSSPELGINDAVALTPAVQSMGAKGKSLEQDLVAKRPQVEKAGQCSEVRSVVDQVASDGQALIAAVIAKVSGAEVKAVASSLAAPLASILAKASDDFSESNCVDASGGGSGSGSSSSSAAATTSAAASTSTAVMSSGSKPASSNPYPTASSQAASTHGSGGSAPTTTAVVVPPPSTGTGAPPASTPTVITAGASLIAPAAALAIGLAVLAL